MKEISKTAYHDKSAYHEKMPYINGLSLARWHDRLLCPFPLKINPYRGCSHGCTYCYLEKTRRIKKYPPGVEPAALDQIYKYFNEMDDGKHDSYIHRCLNMKLPLQVGTSTDPFQPVEKEYKNTYKILELLNDYNYPFILITKGLIPESYFDLFHNKGVIHYTITTSDEEVRKRIEPGTATTKEKLEDIQLISDAGLNLNIRIWPLIPFITDPEQLIPILADMEVSHIVTSMIRLLKYPSFMKKFNDSIHCDYISLLRRKGWGVVNELDQDMISHPDRIKYHDKLRKITNDLGVHYFTPNQPSGGPSCCGVDDIFGDVGSWAVKKNFENIEGKTFHEYITPTGCPFPAWFERYWDQGKLSEFMVDLGFDEKTKTYFQRNNNQEVLM